MKTTSFYKHEDAKLYAEETAKLIGGWVLDREIDVDEKSAQFDEVGPWSGTTPALQICDPTGAVVEFVAYWEC